MIRRLLATTIPLLALPVQAQSVPAANYTDMWWNPSESGWGISFAQHAGSDSRNSAVGSFTFDFANASSGPFTYDIAAPGGLMADDPAFNLPSMAGVKSIQRQSF